METFVSLLLPTTLAMLLLWHLGFAWARLALPAELTTVRLLLTPLLGYASFTIVAATLTNLTPLTPVQIAVGLAAAGLPLNIWAWRGGHETAAWASRRETAWQLAVLALALLVYLSALAPALHNGAAPIGENWDAGEFYIPLGRVLQLHSQSDLGTLPANPLLDILLNPPVSGRIHAFSYLHATASAWSGMDPLHVLPALMALFLALSVPATATLARVLGLGRRAATFAGLLPGLHWMLLWATFNSFAMHVTAFSLLPAALATTIVALDPQRQAGRRAITTAALLAAGLVLSYNPAFTFYIASAAGLLLAWVALACWGSYGRGSLAPLFRRTLVFALLTFVLSGIGQYFFFFREGFRSQYLERSAGMDISSYVSLAAALGLDPGWRAMSPGLPLPLMPAILAALVLVAAALLRRPSAHLLALAASAVAYQGLMFALHYYYGFYKGITFSIPLIAVLLAAGLPALQSLLAGAGALRRVLPTLCGLLILSAVLSAWLGTQHSYWDGSRQLFDDEQLQVLGLRQALPADAEVLVTMPPNRPATFGGLIAYELLGHPLWGDLQTGYDEFNNQPPPGRIAEVALLPAGADPRSAGYDSSELRWSGAGLRLYERSGRATFLRTFPERPVIKPEQHLQLELAADSVELADGAAATGGSAASERQQVALALSSFAPARIQLRSAGKISSTVDLPGGMAVYTTPAADLPAALTLVNAGTEPVYLWRVELRKPGEPAGLTPREDVLFQIRSSYNDGRFDGRIQLHTQQLPGGLSQRLTAVLVFSHTPPGQESREVARWVFFPSRSRDIRLDAELRSHNLSMTVDGQPVELIGSAQPPAEGDYQASLMLANNGRVVAAYGIWYWRMVDGAIVEPYVDDSLCDRIPLPVPATRLRYPSAQAPLQLEGFTLADRRVAPGDSLDLTLVWQALSRPERNYRARLLLLDADGAVQGQVETSLGLSEHPPTRWQVGEIGERTTELPLAADLSAGRYTLAVELIDPSGAPLPLRTPTGEQERVALETIEIAP